MNKVKSDITLLEEKKLQLEIKELQKSWWEQPSYLTIILTFISIMTGILTGYIDVKKMEIGYKTKIDKLSSNFHRDSLSLVKKIQEQEHAISSLQSEGKNLITKLALGDKNFANSIIEREKLKKDILSKTATVGTLEKKIAQINNILNLAIQKEKKIIENSRYLRSKSNKLLKTNELLTISALRNTSTLTWCLTIEKKKEKSKSDRFQCIKKEIADWRTEFSKICNNDFELLRDFDRETNTAFEDLKTEYSKKNKSNAFVPGIYKYQMIEDNTKENLIKSIANYYDRESNKFFKEIEYQ